MARTAPVPNLPPIPGMCPSIAVMGGGGDGGGGSGKGGGNGDGSGPDDGSGNGDGADGAGNGAGSCGNGSGASCTNCQAGTAAGDPVSVASGEVYTLPKTDLFLPGFFNLEILRSYSSQTRRHEVGMGWGWTHSLAWSLHVGRSEINVRTGRGQVMTFPVLERGESFNVDGWALLRTSTGYVLRPGDEFFHVFLDDADDPCEPKLAFVKYRNRGVLELCYERGLLARVIDTAGRTVHLQRDADRRITALSVPDPSGQAIVFTRYAYDAGGHLVEAVDADGSSYRYAYDDDRRLIRMTAPNGVVFHYCYDKQGRCVETWGELPEGDPSLDPNVVGTTLADGVTPARGIYHVKIEHGADGYAEVQDSVRVQRIFTAPGGTTVKAVDGRGGVVTRKLDDHDRIVTQVDANGNPWTYWHDRLGNVLGEQDPEGRIIRFERDREGRVVAAIDPAGNRIEHGLDPHGNLEWMRDPAGALFRFRRNQRGQCVEETRPDGSRRLFEYDSHGNVASVTGPNGSVARFVYDHWGRCVSEQYPDGRRFQLRYTLFGRLAEIHDGLGRVLAQERDALGNLVRERTPDGAVTETVRGGMSWPVVERRPGGAEIRAFYNREGWLTRIVNENGEELTLSHDANGRVIEERSWNGRWRRFKRDAKGSVIGVEDSRGKTVIERNKVGQLISIQAPDGSSRSFGYDARGDLEWAKSGAVEVRWQHDAVGRLVKEHFALPKASHVVTSTLDLMGRRLALETSVGHALESKRDVTGQVSELWVGGEQLLRFTRDPMGWATQRALPEGGEVVDELDGAARLGRRRVHEAASLARRSLDSDEPERLGGPALAVDKTYNFSAVDELLSVTTSVDGTVEFEYDLTRQLVARRDRRGEERFAIDPHGNHREVGPDAPGRRYESGGRLAEHGSTELVTDARGLVVEKRSRRPDGRADRMILQYDGFDMLRGVDLPDGRRLEFAYDAFARRVEKRVMAPARAGKRAVVATTRYVWDRSSVVHEITSRPGAPPSSQTFLYEDQDEVTPLAQLEGSGGVSSWVHLVSDFNGTPEELVDGAGRVVGRLTRDAYGKTAAASGSKSTTPFRFPGQIADPETGLHYNRYRYYDPQAGRYLTPDPIGIAGGYNLYQYGRNPIGWADPMGWAHNMAVTSWTRPGRGGRTTDVADQSGIRDHYVSGMNSDDEADNFCPDPIRNRSTCHTERKLLHDLEENYDREDLAGTTLNLRGEYPPCPNCHRAMMDFARRNNMTINYSYGPGGVDTPGAHTVTYSGGGASGNSTRSRDLVDAYSTRRTGASDRGASSLNPAERYEFEDWDGASTEYRRQRDMARRGR